MIHLWCEDNGCDWKREREREDNGDLELSAELVHSEVYRSVYKQLKDVIIKKIDALGYQVDDDIIREAHLNAAPMVKQGC